MLIDISINAAAVATFCQQHHICKLASLGSVLRDDFRAERDVDVPGEIEETHAPAWHGNRDRPGAG